MEIKMYIPLSEVLNEENSKINDLLHSAGFSVTDKYTESDCVVISFEK